MTRKNSQFPGRFQHSQTTKQERGPALIQLANVKTHSLFQFGGQVFVQGWKISHQ